MHTASIRPLIITAFLLVWAASLHPPERQIAVISQLLQGGRDGSSTVYLPVMLNSGETSAYLYGLDFSPYMDGQSPDWGSQISEDQLRSRMQVIAPYTQWIRTYGMDSGQELSGQVAHELGLKAALGAWLGRDSAANQAQITRLIQAAQAGQADLLIVGSETLYRGDLSPAQLIAYLQQVKAAVPGSIPVTTADTLTKWLENPDLIQAADVVLMNDYPYWGGAAIDQAVPALESGYQQMVAASKGKTVFISETGWPSCGDAIGEAVPSVQNATAYFRDFTGWARLTNVAYFYFEAFDESWKAVHEGPQGACWGVWDSKGSLKYDSSNIPGNFGR
jgi:exo-beta-1,3-glucanase (GH17 family)